MAHGTLSIIQPPGRKSIHGSFGSGLIPTRNYLFYSIDPR
jgi:hypothetical protein